MKGVQKIIPISGHPLHSFREMKLSIFALVEAWACIQQGAPQKKQLLTYMVPDPREQTLKQMTPDIEVPKGM